MSVALAGREAIVPAALPRGAVALMMGLAVVLHLAGGAALYWAARDTGTRAEGQGGLTVGLGPEGAPPGALAAVAADPARTVTPHPVRPEPAADVRAQPVVTPEAAVSPPDVETAPDPVPQTVPPARVVVPESAGPVISPSLAPTGAREASVRSAVLPPAGTSEVPPPDAVTARQPAVGLGVSRRPVPRPPSVAEAGRQAADRMAKHAAPAAPRRDPADPATSRRSTAGRTGQGGAAQGDRRGSGDGAAGGGNPGARADFAATVAARLARAKRYPRRAQRARLEGDGTVWFRMNAAGQVTAARLTRATGHAVLDEAIMDTVRRARLPRIPDSLGRAQMEFSVPMSFRLR